MDIHAIVLAAGKGSRFLPVTSEYHKSLFPLLGESILHRLLSTLIDSGIESLTVAVGWLAEQIEHHLRSLNLQKNVQLALVEDYEIGPLKTFASTVERCSETPILTCPADLLAEKRLTTAFIRNQGTSDALVNIAVDTTATTGTSVYTEGEGRVVSLTPSGRGDYWGRSAMLLGVDKRFLRHAQSALEDGRTRVAQAIEHAISQGEIIRGIAVTGDWFDLDSPESLIRCMKYLFDTTKAVEKSDVYLTSGDVFEVGQQIEFPSGTVVQKNVTLTGPVYIGKRCHISSGTRLGPYVDLENNTRLGSGTTLVDCLAFGNADIGDGINEKQAIICGDKILRGRVS
ncbi:NDP-sugar synthase [Candidatus Thorarchaeota archaeon]|nr:MAG: NDP-sugar synthase [Candidatus Thorarchaeota archaeon]